MMVSPACSVPPWLGPVCPVHKPRPVPGPPFVPPIRIVLPVMPEVKP